MRARLLAVAALLLPSAVGCGYSSGMRLPEHYQTVGIEVFANDSYEPNLERNLHAMMSQQVNGLVQAPIASPAVADVVVEGRISNYSRRGGIRDPRTNALLESAIVIRAEAWLIDRLTGDRIGDIERANVRIGYVIGEQQGEFQAGERALRDIAQRLVLDLFAGLD